ncbi:hypothetical protein [Cytobacillus praedii]|uniref:hypothetical protein n=1 Tax=Cytobacillus praedii TaxID=1742358 RepID=UPI002E224BC1|nr:hypothetical protein [Cytobacillus praedii]
MLKKVGKLAAVGALSLSLVGTSYIMHEPSKVEAAVKKVLPDNHKIQELEVEWGKTHPQGAIIHVGDKKGTLLIRVDQPKTEWNIEWVNWAISKPTVVSFQMHDKLSNQSQIIPFYFDSKYVNNGGKRWANDQTLRYGMMKFSDFANPKYFAALAIYLPQKYNQNGTYWFGGPVQEEGQVKAYFFEDVDVVEDAMKRVGNSGTFPLMNKVMWGKTELWKGQLGKVTIKQPTTLWKRSDDGQLKKERILKVGDEYRVYRYYDEKNGLYGVGGGMVIERDSLSVLYETPSKRNLRLVKIIHGEM